MKLLLALIFGFLSVITTNKVIRDSDTDENQKNVAPLDLKGTLKRSFAAEVMLLNMRENVVCSPLSALLPLGKLILGTDPGESRDEMLKAVGVKKSSIKWTFRELYEKLKHLPGVTLSVASRLYVSRSIEISKKYELITNKVFHSTVEKLNFDNKHLSANVINDWVSSQTNGMIKNIVTPMDISRDSAMILVNAIYFAGRWTEPFKKVFVGDFHSPVGLRRIPMMKQKKTYNYAESKVLNAKIIEIPYEGEKASFVMVLPLSKSGLPMLLSELKLAPELLNKEMMTMTQTKLTLTMPKFKIQTELDLKALYKKIGVKSVFQKDSGLNRISTDSQIKLSKAVQKACIEVFERGTEAAAASGLQAELIRLYMIQNQNN
ncbi:hypothetical protein evm_008244 [Chilo suppressalis]|nr:hypothetical protein evm_008244 [Chilo suppressalis]